MSEEEIDFVGTNTENLEVMIFDDKVKFIACNGHDRCVVDVNKFEAVRLAAYILKKFHQ